MANRLGNVTNKTGKGGFQERPQDRSNGTWDAKTSIGYNYNKLIRFTVEEFKAWREAYPENERTIAQELAYNAVLVARRDLPYLKEVTDRTEGKAMQKLGGSVTVNHMSPEFEAMTEELKSEVYDALRRKLTGRVQPSIHRNHTKSSEGEFVTVDGGELKDTEGGQS